VTIGSPSSDLVNRNEQAFASASWALLLLVPVPTLGVFFAMIFEPTRGTPLGQGIYGFSKIWILALPLIWLFFVDRTLISFSPVRNRGLWTGALLGIIIAAAILGTYWLFARDFIDVEQMRAAAAKNGLDSPVKYLVLVIYLALVNSLLEEYVWRWFVFRKSEVLLGGTLAVFASAGMFTLHHVFALEAQTSWQPTALASLGIFIGGCTWSWLYLRYRSIWPGYVSHIFADIAVFIVGWQILFAS
jgi:uncharacterized protein